MDYLTSDQHIEHNNVLKHSRRIIYLDDYETDIVLSEDENLIRNLKISKKSTDFMNRKLIENINCIVKENDRLWLLGDFVWCNKRASNQEVIESWKYWRDQINCKEVIMIFGNHDPKVDTYARKEVSKFFSRTYDLLTTRIEDYKVVMCHFAQAIWDCKHYNSIHCYAHSHSNAEEWLDKIMENRLSIDVGVDNAYKLLGDYRPFSWKEITDIMSKKPKFGSTERSDRNE